MGSNRQQTMAKIARERSVKEKRERKLEKKRLKKLGLTEDGEPLPGVADDGDLADEGMEDSHVGAEEAERIDTPAAETVTGPSTD